MGELARQFQEIMDLKSMVTLKEWCMHSNATTYSAPETLVMWLSGRVYGHENHEDGKLVTTSCLQVDPEPFEHEHLERRKDPDHRGQPKGFGDTLAPGDWVETQNTVYYLKGESCPR
jgi:hypothetical protein